jgi:hypothetical protein
MRSSAVSGQDHLVARVARSREAWISQRLCDNQENGIDRESDDSPSPSYLYQRIRKPPLVTGKNFMGNELRDTSVDLTPQAHQIPPGSNHQVDPQSDLSVVVGSWSGLSDAIRARIVAMVQASGRGAAPSDVESTDPDHDEVKSAFGLGK